MSADDPARAAYYGTWRTEIYDNEPAAVLDYTRHIPDEWEDYVTEDRNEFEAMAMLSFEHELYQYLKNYSESTDLTAGGT